LVTGFFHSRYNGIPEVLRGSGLDPASFEHDTKILFEFAQQNIVAFYSEFITLFITDLARRLIPNCRAVACSDLRSSFFRTPGAGHAAAKQAAIDAGDSVSLMEWFENSGDVIRSPASFPLYAFLLYVRKHLRTDPLLHSFDDLAFSGQRLAELVGPSAMLEDLINGDIKLASDALLSTIRASWFDKGGGVFCDVPLPNLLINAMLGLYGYPYFPNPRRSFRRVYRAKATPMFLDVLLLDQCRSFFDWFPTLPVAEGRFNDMAFQVLARALIDRIGWHDWGSETHPFHGSALGCINDTRVSKPYQFARRSGLEIALNELE
jgi:hypothetical protein